MSIRKLIPHKTPKPAADSDLRADEIVELPSTGLEDVEVTSLELDDQFDVDCDPYNRTGQHYVEALRRKKD